MGKGASVPSSYGGNTDGICFMNPLLNADFESVCTGFLSNYGEFAVIKIGVIQSLPYPEEIESLPFSYVLRTLIV